MNKNKIPFIFSSHALKELERRKISRTVVDSVVAAPEQKVHEHGEIVCYQSKIKMVGHSYLLRVMVNEIKKPPLIVTVYRTSKIDKYWRKK